ncbi:hypothetical protein C6497_01375 [Candidatus Poribacteria bacterium]|nr:MAG: hypothetical protein C6497_01375 [Candidatus Poribacteria bacterium]
MNNIQSRKLLNAINEMDCDQRKQLLRINTYKHVLSELKTSKASLLELKSKLKSCKNTKNIGTPVIGTSLVKIVRINNVINKP